MGTGLKIPYIDGIQGRCTIDEGWGKLLGDG